MCLFAQARGVPSVGHKRLFLEDLSDQHLRLLANALEWERPDTGARWLADTAAGLLAVFELEGGLIGLRDCQDHVHVEFLVGDGLLAKIAENWAAVQELAEERPIEVCAGRTGAVKVYERLGFRTICTFMRYDG